MAQIDLSGGEQVQGVLPVANGGTGSTTLSGANIEQTANKNAANGYAGLNSSGFVAAAQLGSGSASSATFLRGDSSYAKVTGTLNQINVLDYGADPTGVSDSTTAFTNAISALTTVGGTSSLPTGGGLVYAPTGHYKISSTVTFVAEQGLRGDGIYNTIISYTGTGPCIKVTQSANQTAYPNPSRMEGFTIDGTSSGTGAIGMQVGNQFNPILRDINIQAFGTTGGIGLYLYSDGTGTPSVMAMQATGLSFYYNTNQVVCNGNNVGTGNGNVEYSFIEMFYTCNANQNVFVLKNNMQLLGNHLGIRGATGTGASSNTGVILALDVGNSAGTSGFQNTTFDLSCETLGTGVAHQTIRMDSTSGGSLVGVGHMAFWNSIVGGQAPFQGASIAAGSTFTFSGFLDEPTLGPAYAGTTGQGLGIADCHNFQGGTLYRVQGSASTTLSSGYTIYPQRGDVQEYLLPNTSTSITSFYNAPYNNARKLELLLHQPASGAACVVTWPSNVVWAGGTPDLSTSNGAVDRVRLTYLPSDDKWYGEVTKNYNSTAAYEASVTAAGGTTTLTVDSVPVLNVTGTSSNQTVVLPTTGVRAGDRRIVTNQTSGGVVTVQSSNTNVVGTIPVSGVGFFYARIDTPTANTQWVADVREAGAMLSVFSGTSIGITFNGTQSLYTLPAAFTPVAGVLAIWDVQKNLSANSFLPLTTSTATAAGTTTMDLTSTQVQVFTGTTTQTVKLPVIAVSAGAEYVIINQSTGAVTVQSSGGNTITTLATNSVGIFVSQKASPSAATDWIGEVTVDGKVLTTNNSLTLAGTDGTTMTFPSVSDTLLGQKTWQVAATSNGYVISPNFDDSTIVRTTASASPGNAVFAYTTAVARSGTQCYSIQTSTATSGQDDFFFLSPTTVGGEGALTGSSAIKVQPGQWFYGEIYTRAKATNTATTGSISLSLQLKDSTGVNSITYPALSSVVMSGLSSSAWTKLSGWYQIPSGYDQAWPLVITAGANVASQTFYFDDAHVIENTQAQLLTQQLYGGSTILSHIPASQLVGSAITNAPGATPAINTDNVNVQQFTGLAAAITSMTTNLSGTPILGQKLMISFKDNGTARAITWGTSFQSSGLATLLATTVANKTHWVDLLYDGSKWTCWACDSTGY